MTSDLPASFRRKKRSILESLSRPLDAYTDFSPKGSVDVQIREFVNEINALPGLVTTSSCAGRVSVFAEGKKRNRRERRQLGKSSDISRGDGDDDARDDNDDTGDLADGGGKWLFVSHDPVDIEGARNGWHDFFGLTRPSFNGKPTENAPVFDFAESKIIHFKFEPMVLEMSDQCEQF
jgi:tRNA wybutosine-synthesizing protein 3